jgi:hypothetical protein
LVGADAALTTMVVGVDDPGVGAAGFEEWEPHAVANASAAMAAAHVHA